MGERHGEGADRKGSGGHATEKSRPSRHRGCSGLERLPCPHGHPGFGTSKQLTCFGCSGVLCKMTSKKKKGFRISAWALNICKDSETHLQHRVGFPGSEGPTWPGEGKGGASPGQENGPSPPSFSGTTRTTPSAGGGRGSPCSPGRGLLCHLAVHLPAARRNLPLRLRTILPWQLCVGCPWGPLDHN